MKRRLVWSAVAACVLALVSGLTIWRARPHPVNRANLERIQNAMTLAEVEAIFGCPPGEYATVDCMQHLTTNISEWRVKRWVSDEGEFRVQFDEDTGGHVTATAYRELMVLPQPGLFDRLRAWLGW